MDNYMDSRELMEMKEQLSILTKKLEKETIVNEKLMRRATKEKISKMQRHALIKGIAIALAVPYSLACMYYLGTSWCLNAVTICLLIFALYSDYRIHRNLRSNEAMQGNLLEVRKKVLRIKQAYKDWIKFSIPVTLVWIVWFLYEVSQQAHVSKYAVIIGAVIGGIIGGILGTIEYKKMQRDADEILEQIEEVQ